MKIEKLKDIYDMERYLKEDCYCPGEIYSFDGFFFQVFQGEDKCEYIGQRGTDCILTIGNYELLCVVAQNERDTQLLMICIDADTKKIGDIVRVDATENNIKLVKEVIKNNKTDLRWDEYVKGSTEKGLREIMSMADAIMID